MKVTINYENTEVLNAVQSIIDATSEFEKVPESSKFMAKLQNSLHEDDYAEFPGGKATKTGNQITIEWSEEATQDYVKMCCDAAKLFAPMYHACKSVISMFGGLTSQLKTIGDKFSAKYNRTNRYIVIKVTIPDVADSTLLYCHNGYSVSPMEQHVDYIHGVVDGTTDICRSLADQIVKKDKAPKNAFIALQTESLEEVAKAYECFSHFAETKEEK